MDKFLILFKHELKSRLPLFKRRESRRDVFGIAVLSLVVLMIAAVFAVLLSALVSSYVLVKIDKVSDPVMRAKELINVCYVFVMAALVIAGLERMRRTLTDRKEKELFLRMPVSSETIFLAKLATLLISGYALAFLLIGTVTVIFFTSTALPIAFIFKSLAVWLLMPLAAFLISTLLLVPYIKAVEFISDKYALLLVVITALIIGAFYLYSRFLGAVQALLETGSIKHLFNERFVKTLQGLLKWVYPCASFSEIALGDKAFLHVLIALAIAALAPFAAYLISKRLFTATIYKNEKARRPVGKRRQTKQLSPLTALIKKEFISIYRDPKSTFSYFAVAASMPFMVYCCYTLFDSLIVGAIGMKVTFPLATITVLIFSILTNTFCATNVSRDGVAAIKVKTFPVKPSSILLAKVILCATVSSASIILSLGALVVAADLNLFDAFIASLIAVAFSLAQIFVATKMDLKGARLSSNVSEMRSINDITIAKVVTLGIFLALLAGILSVVSYVFSLASSISFIEALGLTRTHAYLFPALVSALYLGSAIAYYRIGIEKCLDGMSL